jgi:signal transduction histidine kinase
MLQEIGPFTQHDHGWGWQIEAPGQIVTSAAIVDVEEARGPRGPDRRHRRPRRGPRSEETRGLYLRTLVKQTDGGPVTITVAAPRAVVDRMRRAAVTPLLVSLAALGVFLLLATLLQLRIGLSPLARLKASLRDIRAGRVERIPGEQPVELRDVVGELNGLLDENEAALARARGHVANLAHSLKTPLATLNLKLAEGGRDPDGELADLVAQIDRGIRHHLGRARAASPGAPGQPQVDLTMTVAELTRALGRIHAERNIAATVTIAPGLTVKCDPQDLDEMLGNLLDNAWKWARSRIEIAAAAAGADVRILIDDDGPGLSREAIEQALIPGQRLDERGDGHGFGLPIAKELAELHGGALALEASPLGGLRAVLVLPG